MDEVTNDLAKRWPTGHLDYALLKLRDDLGNALASNVRGYPGDSIMPRGWLTFNKTGVQLKEKDTLIIVQHPDDLPIQLSNNNAESVIGFDAGKQRVRYKTNTAKGSSGSPCFNEDWDLVALHHAGDANYWRPGYNQGIPIMLILEDLKHKGLLGILTFGELMLNPIQIPSTPPSVNPPNTESAFEEVMISQTAPFVPRPILKLAMKSVVNKKGTGAKVVLMSGEQRTGYSYSFNFLRQVAQQLDWTTVYLPLKSLFSQAGLATSLQLAQHLLTKMGIDYTIPTQQEFKLNSFFSSFSTLVNEEEDKQF
ncbi:MAG: trypsin-like peptidase domain-containing protein [Saprospiraceae bacterium]|nr:trypsin-like peptidase domain-containing protein [Saprospiraceae bacterium]